MKNSTDAFIEGLDAKLSRTLPDNVVRQARMSLVDYLSCAYLGSALSHGKTKALLQGAKRESGRSKVIGMDQCTTSHMAAMVNGIHSHLTELDDGHRYAMLHGGSPVMSALLAIAGSETMTGDQFLRGVVAGYEATVRLGSAIQPAHKLKGYHATGTCGSIGAALGIAYALGMSANEKKAVLSAAVTSASGLLEMMDDQSQLKPYNVGHAAACALDAAYMAAAGFEGPFDALGGRRGFLNSASDKVDESYLFEGLGGNFAIETIYRKPYAACRHCHAAIEAAMIAAESSGIAIDEIESISVQTYGLAVAGHDHVRVPNTSSAKMSTPYSVAAALVFGNAGFQQFEPNCLSDGRVQALMQRISVAESPELSALVPEKRGAIVVIKTHDVVESARVDYPKGEPENPITEEELNKKFFAGLSASGQNDEYANQLLEAAWHADSDFPVLLELLR